jgi:hypothetical protein
MRVVLRLQVHLARGRRYLLHCCCSSCCCCCPRYLGMLLLQGTRCVVPCRLLRCRPSYA